VLSRWKEHFEQYLNDGEECEQPFDLRDDGVETALLSREGIETVAAGLLKNGGPQLVDALEG
jgi:hypothetical protein